MVSNAFIISLLVLLIALFGIIFFNIWRVRKRDIKQEKKSSSLFSLRPIPIACAGSDDANSSIPQYADAIFPKGSTFFDNDGKLLNIEEYDSYIVHGNSMKYCNIHDGYVIFSKTITEKEKELSEMSYPAILIIGLYQPKPNRPKYKIRRAWKYVYYKDWDSLKMVAQEIIESKSFNVIRNEIKDEEELLKDLKDIRHEDYLRKHHPLENEEARHIIISTTYHTNEDRICFSIHPIFLVEGKVIASFPMETNLEIKREAYQKGNILHNVATV